MHVLMAVDVIGGRPHALLEAVELASDLGRDLVPLEQSKQGARDEVAKAWERALRRQPRHGTERGSEREVKMQPDAQVTAVCAQAWGASRPMGRRDQHARCRQPLGGGELADGAGNPLRQGVVVGAEDDHAGKAFLARWLSSLLGSACAQPGNRGHCGRGSRALDALEPEASGSKPSSSATMYNGRPF